MRLDTPRRGHWAAVLGRVEGRFQAASPSDGALRRGRARMPRAAAGRRARRHLGLGRRAPAAERPDDATKSPVESPSRWPRAPAGARRAGRQSGSSRGEPELGRPALQPAAAARRGLTLRVLAPGVARASDAQARRAVAGAVRGGVVWLERSGIGTCSARGCGLSVRSTAPKLAPAASTGGARRRTRTRRRHGLRVGQQPLDRLCIVAAAALDGPVDVLAVSRACSRALMRHGQVRERFMDPVASRPAASTRRPPSSRRSRRSPAAALAPGRPEAVLVRARSSRVLPVPPAAVVDVLHALMCCSDVVRVVCRCTVTAVYGGMPPAARR